MSAVIEARDKEAVETAAVAIVNETVATARAIEVETPEQAHAAVEFLSRVSDAKKRNEAARLFIVGPFNEQIKAINKRFKDNAAPLEVAEAEVKAKVLTFQQREAAEVAKRQAAEDAARREREAEAEAERRRQAEAAEKAEREAREAEEKRQAELREAENERAREIAAMSDEELAERLRVTLSEGEPGTPERLLVAAEIKSRKDAAEARAHAEKVRREAEEATQASIALASAPAVSVEATSLSSASGSAHARQRWVATVEDEPRVPREYLMVDTKKINAAVKEGVREISGVKIEQETGLAVRAGR